MIDVIESRQGPELTRWLDDRPETWRAAVSTTVTDLHEPFRKAHAQNLPNAVAIADPFHVVGVANRALDKTRRAVQTETLGHRGRSPDPLYRGPETSGHGHREHRRNRPGQLVRQTVSGTTRVVLGPPQVITRRLSNKAGERR